MLFLLQQQYCSPLQIIGPINLDRYDLRPINSGHSPLIESIISVYTMLPAYEFYESDEIAVAGTSIVNKFPHFQRRQTFSRGITPNTNNVGGRRTV